jgi:hypothetical protein
MSERSAPHCTDGYYSCIARLEGEINLVRLHVPWRVVVDGPMGNVRARAPARETVLCRPAVVSIRDRARLAWWLPSDARTASPDSPSTGVRRRLPS